MPSITVTHSVDVRGLSCPIPIVRTAQAMKQLAAGDLIEVLATDPGSLKDFPAWSKTTGHTILETSQEGLVYRFLLQKKG